MFFYRYSLAEPGFDRDGCRLHRMVIVGEAELINYDNKTGVGVWKYDNVKDDRVEYVMINQSVPLGKPEDYQICNPQVMGFCSLARLEDWAALETAILYAGPNWRRHGVATKLYDAVLKDGQILICGWSHNPKSKALWVKMMQNPSYVVWAQDMKDLSRTSDVWLSDDNEVICNLKLYVDIKMKKRKMKEDVRLLAINPKFCK